jgi:hypothetical protein
MSHWVIENRLAHGLCPGYGGEPDQLVFKASVDVSIEEDPSA